MTSLSRAVTLLSSTTIYHPQTAAEKRRVAEEAHEDLLDDG